MTGQMHRRHAFNKAKDALFGPEQVTYKKDEDEPVEPVAQKTPEDQAILPRTDHFDIGQQEGSIVSMGKFKEDKANKALMEGTD